MDWIKGGIRGKKASEDSWIGDRMKNRILYGNREISDALDAKYKLTSGDCLLELSPQSDSLAANTLEFEVESDDTSLVLYSQNDKLIYEHNGKQIGVFYIQSVNRIGKTYYLFTAMSAMGLFMNKTHYGGLYDGQTAESVIYDIFSGLPFHPEIKSIFQEYKIYGWLPIASARDNLSQVLFAIGAALKTESDGTLRITSLYRGVSWAISEDLRYAGGSVDYGSPVSRIILTEHRWVQGGETTTLFTGTASDGDIIRFDEPVYDIQASGFEIYERNCNFAKVTAGTGSITGKK